MMGRFKLNQKDYLLGGLLLLGVGCILMLQTTVAPLITRAFESGQIEDLNFWAGSGGEHSLDFYQGEIRSRWTGPVSNILCHFLLALVLFFYASGLSFWRFTLCIFLFLVVTKFNVLFYPPYGDAIGGPFAEAIWLKNHHFNYLKLFDEPAYQLGGPKVYFFSVYPTYLALLYTLIPSVKMFLFVNHLLVFAMAAVIVSLIRNMSAKIFDEKSALLSSIIVLALPLFQSQAEAINMEMPCLFFSVLAIYYLICKSLVKATLYALICLWVKGHGILVCGTVFAVSIFLCVFDRTIKKDWNIFFALLALPIVMLLKVGSKFLLNDQHVSAGMVKFLAGWPSLKIMYLFPMYALSVVVIIFFMIKKSLRNKDLIKKMCTSYYPTVVIIVTGAMWFLLFLNFYAVSPRYKLALAPYLILCMIIACLSPACMKKIRTPFLFLVLIATALGSYGFYHVPLGANYHIFLERSLEYRQELTMNRKLISTVKGKYKDLKVAAPFLMAQILAMPEYGYVRKAADVTAYGMPIFYGDIKNFEGLKKMDIMKTVWIGLAADYMNRGRITYPVHSRDKVVDRIEWGRAWSEIFIGGFAIEQRWKMIHLMQYRKSLSN